MLQLAPSAAREPSGHEQPQSIWYPERPDALALSAGTRADASSPEYPRPGRCLTRVVLANGEFLNSFPRKRITAGALIRDVAGRVLLVQPTYREDWLTPGGTVESRESPAQGAGREVLEELGVRLLVGRPLVMQWVQPKDDPDGVLNFVYDGGTVTASSIERFRLPPVELASYRFVEPELVPTLASPETSARVAAALEAVAHDTFVELGH